MLNYDLRACVLACRFLHCWLLNAGTTRVDQLQQFTLHNHFKRNEVRKSEKGIVYDDPLKVFGWGQTSIAQFAYIAKLFSMWTVSQQTRLNHVKQVSAISSQDSQSRLVYYIVLSVDKCWIKCNWNTYKQWRPNVWDYIENVGFFFLLKPGNEQSFEHAFSNHAGQHDHSVTVTQNCRVHAAWAKKHSYIALKWQCADKQHFLVTMSQRAGELCGDAQERIRLCHE